MGTQLPLGRLLSVTNLFAKLKRDAEHLEKEVTSDGLFNFVLTGYSMIDWIKNHPSVPSSAKEKKELDGLHADVWLKICGDLATGAKHFSLDRRIPVVSQTPSAQGYGLGRFGKGAYGGGEESICIELNDGARYSSLELVQGVLSTWETFFSKHGIV